MHPNSRYRSYSLSRKVNEELKQRVSRRIRARKENIPCNVSFNEMMKEFK